jgi:hypothetical protein
MAAYVTIVVTVLIFVLAAALYLAGTQMQGH